MARIPNSIVSLFLIFLLSSCDSNRIYEINKDLSDQYWHKDSVQTFSFDITEADRNYNVYLNLRNASTYLFQNIYVQYQLEDSTGREIKTELKDFQLFHPQTGKPFGSSSIGDIFDHQFLILENYNFPFNGKYRLECTQMMRMDSLNDILSVGARVEFYQTAN